VSGTAAPVEQEAGDERSLGSRSRGWLAIVLAIAVTLVLFMHVVAPAIGSDEESPDDHFSSACIACHIITNGTGTEQP
jgi:hypothetical protein